MSRLLSHKQPEVRSGLRTLPLVAVLAALLPLRSGFPRGHDWGFELTRVAEFSHAMSSGQWPPYWAENMYGSYGSPVFLFYAPLHAGLAAGLAEIFGSFTAGATGAIAVLTLLGAFSFAGLAHAVWHKWDADEQAASRVALYAFLLNPYLICNAYLRNANAEFAALCVMPLALHGLLILDRSTARGSLLIAIGMGLTILAHNLSALTLAVILIAGGLIVHFPRRGNPSSFKPLLGVAVGTLIGIAIAAFLWMPALTLQALVQTEELTLGKFDFHRQFQPVSSFFGYTRVYAVGVVPPLMALLGGVLWLRNRRALASPFETRLAMAIVVGCALFLFLQLRASTPLWEVLPFLELFQFPWRFMGPLTILFALASALGFASLPERMKPRRRMAAEIAILSLLIANASPHWRDIREIDSAHAQTFEAQLGPEKLRRSGAKVTVLDEYLPKGARSNDARRFPPRHGPVVSSFPEAKIRILKDEYGFSEMEIDAREETRVRFARWNFPVWRLTVDDLDVKAESSAVHSLEVMVPAGHHRLKLELVAPRSRKIGLAVSAFGVMSALLLVLRRPIRLWRWLD